MLMWMNVMVQVGTVADAVCITSGGLGAEIRAAVQVASLMVE